MSVPNHVRQSLRNKLSMLADEIGWADLSPTAKSRHYESWTLDPHIGGRLAHYIDKGQVRVYIKDTLLKDYVRKRSGDETRPFRALGIAPGTCVSETYIKPHGRRLHDGRVLCWGRADAWKGVVLAVYERAYLCDGAQPFAAVLTHAMGRYRQDPVRVMVEEVAKSLGIKRLCWLET